MNKVVTLLIVVIVSLVGASTNVFAQTRVVVTGEDSNHNSVKRTSEVFRRVISQLQESMNRGGYYVLDEDMLGVKLGFSFNSRRPKTELIETLMVANDTEDATVQSRLAVVFAVFPQVKTLSFTRKLEIRVRGDIYDLKTLRPLTNFEYKPLKAYIIPKSYQQCDTFCTEELIGLNAREVARELGDILVRKLNIVVEQIGGKAVDSGKVGQPVNPEFVNMPKTYSLSLIRFKTPQAVTFRKTLEKMSDIKSAKTLGVRASERKLAIETAIEQGLLEEMLYEALMHTGIDTNAIRFEITGTEIIIENFGK